VVSLNTTIYNIETTLISRKILPRHLDVFPYLSMKTRGLRTVRLNHSDTLRELCAGSLTHIFIYCPLLGGLGPEDGEAVDENGQLKDAADMVWFNDKDDTVPIASASGTRMFYCLVQIINIYFY
jgi:hypothetical protein